MKVKLRHPYPLWLWTENAQLKAKIERLKAKIEELAKEAA